MAITIASISVSGGNTIISVNNNGWSVTDPATAIGSINYTFSYGGVALPIQSFNGAEITLTGVWSPSPGTGVEVVIQPIGGGGAGPSVVDKKYVQQNDGYLGGSLTDLRANTGVFTGQLIVSGGLDVAGDKIVNVAAGTDPTDAVNVSQLESYVTAEISAAAVDEDSRLTELEGRASTIESDLSSEISRSTEADNSLENRLSLEEDARAAEASRATAAEASIYSNLSSALDNEASIRREADASLSSALSSEAETARGAEASLSALISNEVADRSAAVSAALSSSESYTDSKIAALVDSAPELLDTLNELAAALGDDPNFATTIVSTIGSYQTAMSTALSSEVSRATEAEASVYTTLSSGLSSEASRAGAAEASVFATLSSGLSSEASRATEAEASVFTTLSSGLSSEASRAGAAEASVFTTLSSGLSSEASRALEAEASVFTTLSSGLSSEASRAGAAEASVFTTLSSGLSSEASRATEVETSLENRISLEEDARISNVDSLQSALSVEVAARSTAVSTEASLRSDADLSIITDMQNADASLSSLVSSEASRAGSVEVSLENRLSVEEDALASEIDRATSAEFSLASDLVDEVNRAELAEQSIINRFDAQLAGLTWKNSVKVMITGSLTAPFADLVGEMFDGEVLTAGQRVLVNMNAEQGGNQYNGIWVVSTGSWARATDMDETTPINEVNSAAVFVENGTMYHDTGWVQVNTVAGFGPNDLINFVQFNGAAGIVAGAGLTKTGNTLDIGSDYTITVGADQIGVSVSYTQERDAYADTAVSTLSTTVSAALSNEIADRIADVQSLSSALSIEASDRAAADSSLSSLVSSEASRAESVEVSLSSALSTEASDRGAADSSLSSALSSEASRAESVEVSLEARISAEEVATDSRLDDIENNYLDRRVGGNHEITGSFTIVDSNLAEVLVVNEFAPGAGVSFQVNGDALFNDGVHVDGYLTVGTESVNLVPVIAKLTTSGSNNEASAGAMFDDLSSFTGMIMANFQVVAMDSGGVGHGMAGEYRVSGFCNAGDVTVSSVVELEQAMIGANLDVNILSDGTVRVSNGNGELGQYKWHVQRVKMVAVNAAGDVK